MHSPQPNTAGSSASRSMSVSTVLYRTRPPNPRMDKQVVATYPSDAGKHAHVLVGDMPLLVLPVDHLGGGKGQGPVSCLLDLLRKHVGDRIQAVVHLSVVMKIKEGRPVGQRLQHTPRDQQAEGDGKGESGRKSSPKPRISLS